MRRIIAFLIVVSLTGVPCFAADTKLSALPTAPSGCLDFIYGEASSTSYKQAQVPCSLTVSLSASDINHMFSAPKTVLAAPGAGKAIIPLFAEWYNHVGTVPTGSPGAEAGNLILTYGGSNGSVIVGDSGAFEAPASTFIVVPTFPGFYGNAPLTDANSPPSAPPNPLPLFSAIANQPLVVSNNIEDYIKYGSIASSSITSGNAGTGYAIGDTGKINAYNSVTSILATYVIDTVDGGGAVLTYHLSAVGAGYKTATTGNATTPQGSQPGSGTGFEIDVNSVTPGNGSGAIRIIYEIVTLP